MAESQVKTAEKPQDSYITWEEGDDHKRAIALYQVTEALGSQVPVVRTQAGTGIYLDVAPNSTSIRDGFNRSDFEAYRPGEAMPRKPKDIIASCDEAIERFGLIQHVINMMSEFSAKGIAISHPVKEIENFLQEWAKKVDMAVVSERFAHYILLHATTIVRRQNQTLNESEEEQMRRAKAGIDEPIPKRTVPWSYTFYHPNSVELLSPELSSFLGESAYRYGVKIPTKISNAVKAPQNATERALVAQLPDDLKRAIKAGETVYALDPKNTTPYWYKKNNWSAWPKPLLTPILRDLQTLEKLRLADLAALDGAISSIRVWKLGDLERRIIPPPSLLQRLSQMLTSNIGGGVMDLVWGPDINLLETSTDAHHFLGSGKYAATMQAIYAGLGIPQSLAGDSNNTGFTNNYIALKVFTERLEYVRLILKKFWNNELRLVQKAMGFRKPGKIFFDSLLTDDAAMQNILLNMYDRNLIDEETLQEETGFDPETIAVRRKRENNRIASGKNPPRSSPYHNPNMLQDITKTFAATGNYVPSEFGIELDDPQDGQVPPAETSAKRVAKYAPKPAPVASAPKGQPGKGRPLGNKDKTKRKQKVVKPRKSASATFFHEMLEGEKTLASVSKILTPKYLKTLGKKTLRELTEEESAEFEDFKFKVLCQLELGEEATAETLQPLLLKPLEVPQFVNSLMEQTVQNHIESYGKEPTIDILRRYQASVFAIYKGEDQDDDEEAGDFDDSLQAISRTEEELEGYVEHSGE